MLSLNTRDDRGLRGSWRQHRSAALGSPLRKRHTGSPASRHARPPTSPQPCHRDRNDKTLCVWLFHCHLAHLPAAGLLKLVATQLGETPRRGKDRVYEQILERAGRTEGTLMLIFDEAHLLSSESLTDVRLLISSALDVGPLLKILLVGQESLRVLLRRAQHADLLNRVSCRFQLRPLHKEQTADYIDFQIKQAGGDWYRRKNRPRFQRFGRPRFRVV